MQIPKHIEDEELIEQISRPFHIFAHHKLSGTAVLIVVSLIAMVWANSSLNHVYAEILSTHFSVGFGDFVLSKPMILWINDGLMGLFFFVVGLEIKREVLAGELSSLRNAILPVFAALGGMIVPALIYHIFNMEGDGVDGWGIPMATDIAFALGLMALLPVPVGLKVFLTALAIVDDLGAIVVIALFYTGDISITSLGVGLVVLATSIAANLAGVRNPIVYFLLGSIVWLAFLKSGVHATLAAVLMALTIPARTRIDGKTFSDSISQLLAELMHSGLPQKKQLLSTIQHTILHEMEQLTEKATAPLQELEHAMMPFVTFIVLPVFALANAGVQLHIGFIDAIRQPAAYGIIFGLVIGKPLGIFTFTWLLVRLKLADLPTGVDYSQLLAVGFLGGIGFTMSLFVSGLAFPQSQLTEVAKVGILTGSIISAIIGLALLSRAVKRARQ